MTSVADVWRAVDPEARIVSGLDGLGRAVRMIERTRAAPPHLPASLDAALLVADGALIGSFDELVAALQRAELVPAAVLVCGLQGDAPHSPHAEIPILASQGRPAALAERAAAYLADEGGWLQRLSTDLRLACAEAALGEPAIATPAGLIAARLRRGVAVTADGRLATLHARHAGRALAARFAALHDRLLTGGSHHARATRRTRDGIWLLERPIRPGATLWLFDDLPLAAVDEVAADAAALTLRALLRRPPEGRQRATPAPRKPAPAHDESDPLLRTLLVVARHNGRVAPAARELGVHRNTVLYRLRRAATEHGVDPRRPEDALRLLREGGAGG